MRLTIRNIEALESAMMGTDWHCTGINTTNDYYYIRLRHDFNQKEHTIILYRNGSRSDEGWSFITSSGRHTGTVSLDYLRRPENLVQHILLLLK